MAKGKGSSGSRGRNPSKPKKPQKKPDKKPQKKPDKKPKQSGKGGAGSGKQGGGKQGGGSGKQRGGSSGSKVDVGKIIDIVGSVLDRLDGKKPGGAEPKTPEPSGGTEPKPGKTSQADLQKYIDMLDKEVASENPDKELMAGLVRKIKAALASSGGDAGALTTRLDDVLKKLEAPK